MLRQMERSTMQWMAKRGKSIRQIAQEVGHNRRTVARVLREPVERRPATRQRRSQVDPYRPQIARWLEEGLTAVRMLELARQDPERPYTGRGVRRVVGCAAACPGRGRSRQGRPGCPARSAGAALGRHCGA